MTTYSINLDDVDLALLPLRTSYNNFLKKEHYQFEVMKTVTFEVPEPSILYTCHICAIDMPAAFAHEHAVSIKHRANARIASVAAQRMLALISAPPPPPIAQPAARFCANCTTLTDDDHYKTRGHQDAVTRDNLLWDLMKAYAQEDESKYDKELSNNQINRSTRNNKDKNNENKKENLEIKYDGNNTNNNAMVLQPKDTNQLPESIDRGKSHKPIQEEEPIAKKKQIGDSEVMQYNDDHEFTDNINDNISNSSNITAANNTVVPVKSGRLIEYPYEVTAKGHIQCVVCECQVPSGVQSREEHVKGSRHRTMVRAQNQPTGPIEKAEQFAKKCELNDTLDERNKDDKFTDVITDNISTDISKSKYTAVTIKSSDVKDNSQIAYPFEITVTGHVWCTVCECEVTSGERNREEHIGGLKHRRVVTSRSQPIQPMEDKEEEQMENNNEINDNSCNITEPNHIRTVDSLFEYPYKVTATGHVQCLVCKCQVPSGEQSIEEHAKGWEHHNMTRATKSIEEEEQTAEDCETNDSFKEHSEDEKFDNNDNNSISSNIHEANYGNIIADCQIEYPFKITATGRVECVVCNCQVPNHEQNRKEHIKGRRHRNMMNRVTESVEEEERTAEDCENNESFEEYSENEEFNNNDNNSMGSIITEANYGNTITDSQIEYPFEITATGQVECVVCNCQVPNCEQNRKEHIEGLRHRNMMNIKMESVEEEEQIAGDCETDNSFEENSEEEEFDNNDNNSLSSNIDEANYENIITDSQIEYPFEITATGRVECVVCNCQVPNCEQNIKEHIIGLRHRNMMNRATESVEEEQIAEDCETNDSFEEYSEDGECDNNDGMSTSIIADSQIEYPFEITATGHVMCVVCECKVPRNVSNREEHVQGMRHRNMVLNINQPEESIEEEEEQSAENNEIDERFEECSEEDDEEYYSEEDDEENSKDDDK